MVSVDVHPAHCSIFTPEDYVVNVVHIITRVTRGGLQPETLADRLLVKQSQPASKIETNSDKNFENLYES